MDEKCFCPRECRRNACGVCLDRLLQGVIAIGVIIHNIDLLPQSVIVDFWARLNDCGVSEHPLFENIQWPDLDAYGDDSRYPRMVGIPEGDEGNPIVLPDE